MVQKLMEYMWFEIDNWLLIVWLHCFKESQKASEAASDQLRAITQDRDTQIQTLQEANKVN